MTLGQDWHHYSVPYHHIGKTVQIVYDTDHVEIYLNSQRIAIHQRNYQRNGYTTLAEHMPPAHQHYVRMRGWTGEYFVEKATQIGTNTTSAISRILQQKIFIEQTYRSCRGILRLGEEYGNNRLENACKRSLAGYKVTYTIVKNILEHNLDQAPLPEDPVVSIPDHDNIRGADAYR